MYRYFTDLDFWWAMQGGLKMLSIRLNRHESFPLLSIHHVGSRFARRDSMRTESRRSVWIKLNRKVPQTNQLSLGVLDMDGLNLGPPALQSGSLPTELTGRQSNWVHFHNSMGENEQHEMGPGGFKTVLLINTSTHRRGMYSYCTFIFFSLFCSFFHGQGGMGGGRSG